MLAWALWFEVVRGATHVHARLRSGKTSCTGLSSASRRMWTSMKPRAGWTHWAMKRGREPWSVAVDGTLTCARALAQDMHNELQEVMGQSFGVPEDVDEDELMGELDALEDELAMEAERPAGAGAVPAYLQARSLLLPCFDCGQQPGSDKTERASLPVAHIGLGTYRC